MEERLRQQWQPTAVDEAERKRIRIALRQLEWADVYLQAAAGLELADPETRHAIHLLRAQLQAASGRLGRLSG
ncbi:MAG: hypothetical protein NVS9B1_02950 [Candidatus Dormibacteraceae bacterium]